MPCYDQMIASLDMMNICLPVRNSDYSILLEQNGLDLYGKLFKLNGHVKHLSPEDTVLTALFVLDCFFFIRLGL